LDQILKTVNSLDERMKAIETNFAVFKTKIESNTTQIKQIKVEQDKIRKTITQVILCFNSSVPSLWDNCLGINISLVFKKK